MLSATYSDELAAPLTRYIDFFRITPGEALRKQSRLLVRDILKITPPAGDDESSPRAQGEAAVARDIKRAVYSLQAKNFREPRIQNMIRRRDYVGLKELFSKMPNSTIRNASFVPFYPELHERQRDSRGRVNRTKQQLFATAEGNQVSTYIRRKKKNVGMAKGGWAAGASMFGVRVAKWISRHAGMGSVEDKSRTLNPFIVLTNRSPWARSGVSRDNASRSIQEAVRMRARLMLEEIDRRLSGKARQERLTA